MIDYFITDKGDITGWEEREEIIAAEYPELIVALHNLTIAKRTLRAIVKSIASEDKGGE